MYGVVKLYGVVGRVLWYVNFTVAHLCSHSIFYWGVFGQGKTGERGEGVLFARLAYALPNYKNCCVLSS